MRSILLDNSLQEKYIFSTQEQFVKSNILSYPLLAVEIGCGNGHFLVQIAQAMPDVFFVGCELDKKRVFKTVKKLSLAKIETSRVFLGRGEILLSFFPENSLSAIYVNFPDPWPKKRHHRRRFFYPQENLNLVVSRLKSGGRLYFVSDHEEYFFFTLNERLFKNPFLFCPFEAGFVNALPDYFSTLYEEKFKKMGKTIYYTYFQKKS